MKIYILRASQRLPVTLDVAWSFFSDPRNLASITPPSLNLSPTCAVPDTMYEGMIITYRVKPFLGVASTWVSEITHVSEPHYFVDEQRFGPYKYWHHEHRFRAIPGGTEAEDLIHYALPFDPFSRLVHRLVRRQLDAIFSYRNQVLAKRFGVLT